MTHLTRANMNVNCEPFIGLNECHSARRRSGGIHDFPILLRLIDPDNGDNIMAVCKIYIDII